MNLSIDRWTEALAAGQTRLLFLTGRSFLCLTQDGSVDVAFDSQPAVPLLAGFQLRDAEGWRQIRLTNTGATAATVSFLYSTGEIALAPVGVNQIVTG